MRTLQSIRSLASSQSAENGVVLASSPACSQHSAQLHQHGPQDNLGLAALRIPSGAHTLAAHYSRYNLPILDPYSDPRPDPHLMFVLGKYFYKDGVPGNCGIRDTHFYSLIYAKKPYSSFVQRCRQIRNSWRLFLFNKPLFFDRVIPTIFSTVL